MTDTLQLACAATPDHVGHSAAMLHSVHEHRGGLGLHVHYLHDAALTVRTRGRLTRWLARLDAEVTFHEVTPATVAGLPRLERIPVHMWFRVVLPVLLTDMERVLYLDVDTLAVDDLGQLWHHDLAGHPFGAVTNVLVEPEHRDHVARLGVSAQRYINSGVLLLDLERMRAANATGRLLAWGRNASQTLLFPEQDALSVVLGEARQPLHPRWNAMNSVLEYPEAVDVFGADVIAEARARPGIRHFEGPSINKPWHYRCARGMSELYRHHRRRTPWPLYQPDGRTPRAVLGRLRRRMIPTRQ